MSAAADIFGASMAAVNVGAAQTAASVRTWDAARGGLILAASFGERDGARLIPALTRGGSMRMVFTDLRGPWPSSSPLGSASVLTLHATLPCDRAAPRVEQVTIEMKER